MLCVCVMCVSNVWRAPQPPQEHSCPSGNGNLPSLCRWCPVSTEQQHYTTTHTFIALRWIVNIALSNVQGMWYDGYLWQWRVPYHSCFQSEGQISHSSHRFPRSDKKECSNYPQRVYDNVFVKEAPTLISSDMKYSRTSLLIGAAALKKLCVCPKPSSSFTWVEKGLSNHHRSL